ncbi:GNAT family N-acetyltransferase [Carboxylicivirga linearis]|uniref:GNAT family N-acetyltransferase n=1 Tax=Carboxylicivirga linearis TaxID=1628157 RepID=A0ABS5JSR8_9BACT|nr:GNAT family N-acetyltransferase [Carboxylicivirga linearis]MBS2097920.1 GNAT family N-acetyltransferase [Carboxylicivirga linearis]
MFETKVFDAKNKPSLEEKNRIIDFLFTHLDEYGDPKSDIEKSIQYALKETESFGGFVLCAEKNNTLIGAVVVNQTGMKDYIPENILVYIAIHNKERGNGYGKELLEEALKIAEGNVALHVEPDNPARFLYQKVGFSSKYVEMRYLKN